MCCNSKELLKNIESLPSPITILAAITRLHSSYQQHNSTVSSSRTQYLRLLISYSSLCLSSPRVLISHPNKATAITTLQTKSRGTPIRELRKPPCLITCPRVLRFPTVSQRCAFIPTIPPHHGGLLNQCIGMPPKVPREEIEARMKELNK